MKIHFYPADTAKASAGRDALVKKYTAGGGHADAPLEEADVIVACGGDGLMLRALHDSIRHRKPVFGINRGAVGFLLNEYREDGLAERLARVQTVRINPLHMRARTADGKIHAALAINEVSLLRETHQTAKLRISVDGVVRLDELNCDGIIAATPAGSTAYNLAAHGPIIPLGAGIMALTPLSPFRPRRWRGALLPLSSRIVLDVLDADKRPVAAVADFTEVRDVENVEIWRDKSVTISLLFDPEMNLAERIIKEQFMP